MKLFEQITSHFPVGGMKPENFEYYFALNIGLSEITAAVWTVNKQSVEIHGQAVNAYEGEEDLLDKASIVLDESLGALPTEPQKILFGVPASWTLDDNLKDPYLKLLGDVTKEFDLEPMAYVTTTHAIAHLLQKIDGVPPTALMIGVGDFLEITLVRGGKVVDSKLTKRTSNLFADIEKTLLQFTEVEVLPSKILLYAISENENIGKIKDELMTYPWMNRLPFLHYPKIEELADNVPILAIVYAGASELNPDVNIKIAPALTKPTLAVPLGKEVGHPSTLHRLKHQTADATKEKNLGFVTGDIKTASANLPESKEEAVDQDTNQQSEKEVFEENEKELTEDSLITPPEPEEDLGEVNDRRSSLTRYQKETSWPKEYSESGKQILPSALSKQLQRISATLPKFTIGPANLWQSFGSKIAILVIFVGLILVAYVILVKASVTVFVEPQILEKSAQVIADPKAKSVDEEQKIIPAALVETTVTGSGKATATGSKEIGDPAKGQVIVYNKTDSPKTFAQGTVLGGPENLKFTLDSSVIVASQSAVEGGIAYGKATASVTASAIGPDSNLSAGTEMTISQQSNSDFEAKVDQALSGGTSKEVTVVTSDDQKKLQAKVIDDLRQKALEKLQKDLPAEKKILAESLVVTDGKYSFNKQVNDQAADFTLNATVHFKGTSYSDADLRSIVAKLVETNVPENFQLNLQDTETQADVSKVEKDGKLIFAAKFRAKLMPKLDVESLKKQIKGQSVENAAATLRQIDHVIGSEITLTPSLPAKISRLPIMEKNITITVTPK